MSPLDITTGLDLTGRVALVTGGTKGIGFAIAEQLLGAGAHVVVCGRNRPDVLPTVDDRVAEFLAADVRAAEEAAALVDRTVASLGRLDVVVNNAGGSPDADAATVSTRFVDKIVSLNMLAPFYVARAANRVMQTQPAGGTIVNIGSVSAHDPQPGTAAYSAAKAGLLMFTKAAAAGYGGDGGAAVADIIPMQRMTLPADIAHACLFLCSDMSAYLNGADIAVHGGGEVPGRYLVTRSP